MRRFSAEERQILVEVVVSDQSVLSGFCHMQRRPGGAKRSIIHEIAARFNAVAPAARSYDVVRDHLKIRGGEGDSALARDARILEKLLGHPCSKVSCTRCLQLHRMRVQRGLARCGMDDCPECPSQSLPLVLAPFDAGSLLLEVATARLLLAPPPGSAHSPAILGADGDDAAGGEGREGREGRVGRFSAEERKILVGAVVSDPSVLSGFCHMRRRRGGAGRSILHEIAARFNAVAPEARSYDVVRHHLKIRSGEGSSALADDAGILEKLLGHICSKVACTHCLQLHRMRVQRGLARCGVDGCTACPDQSLPLVLAPFDASALLLEVAGECGGAAASGRL
jgi:hypothetical protein